MNHDDNIRELLELAAKAAGLRISNRLTKGGLMVCSADRPAPHKWNPRDDDGDALRLAVACRLTVCTDGDATVSAFEAWLEDGRVFVTQRVSEGRRTATRLAIVRAAAEIGRRMP
ncbi:hypothetical protein N8I74_15875 [Chitiniphilus purpureus]|uniref:Uncharacterized protein n=1 Tax=Chitiniphilus purpureus TaxID=2981137 RepID=A0ABY6DK88_9NEIS|nr:hypothetical protein [Chitiniphilus sp. CD1]UXY14782.1 hypothetical protein N8I74_15875 [Chitiniphilus sp. CD1]